MISSIMKMARIDWLLDRRKGIGGSDVAAIMGLNKWKSAYQIWLEKQDRLDYLNQTASQLIGERFWKRL